MFIKPGRKRKMNSIGNRGLRDCIKHLRKRSRMPRRSGIAAVRPAYYVGAVSGKRGSTVEVVWDMCFENGQRAVWSPEKESVIDLKHDFKRQRMRRKDNGRKH